MKSGLIAWEMGPLAEGAELTAVAEALVPAKLLRDGEVVILAVRPSGWFALLVSLPALAVAAVIALAAVAARGMFGLSVSKEVLLLFCALVGCLRLGVALVQWMGRLYILTNLRVVRLRGVVRVDVFEIPLKKIVQTRLVASVAERPLGVGSLCFETAEGRAEEASWIHVARPAELQQMVNDAIRRVK